MQGSNRRLTPEQQRRIAAARAKVVQRCKHPFKAGTPVMCKKCPLRRKAR